jgi:hypothetical protein
VRATAGERGASRIVADHDRLSDDVNEAFSLAPAPAIDLAPPIGDFPAVVCPFRAALAAMALRPVRSRSAAHDGTAEGGKH